MEEVDVPFPDGISIQAIQEDLKPGGESLVLGNHIIGEMEENSWNPIAGSATESGYYNGGANTTRFNSPSSFVQLDEAKIVIADRDNHCLRLLSRESEIMTTTFSGECESSGLVDGDANLTRFSSPRSIARDLKSPEFLIVFDGLSYGTKIRLVDSSNGYTTINKSDAGTFYYFTQNPLTFDLYVCGKKLVEKMEYDNGFHRVKVGELVPSNTPYANLPNHTQVRFIDDDTLLIADEHNNKLRMFELSTKGSETICTGGTSSSSSADLASCNIDSPVAFYIHTRTKTLYVVNTQRLYVIKGK